MRIPSRRWLLVAAALAAIAPLAAIWPGAGPLLLALDAIWVLAFALDASLAPAPGLLEIARVAPPAFSVGRSFPVWYDWSHPLRRAVEVRVRERLPEPLGAAPADRRLRVTPGAPTRERLDLRPLRRGEGDGGTLDLRLLGPLGLAWRQGRIELPWRALVFPSLLGVARALPAQAARRREAGLREIRRPGEGRLFEGLREWVPGDDTRIIDWKATARRGKPIARVYEDERRQQVMLMIDAGRLLTAEAGGVPRLEAVIQAALALAAAAVEQDDNVGLMVFADEILHFSPPARGRRALRGVLEALAAIEGRLVESDYPRAFRYLAARNRKRALTVLFTDVIDRTASEALVAQSATLRPRHLPVAITLRDPALDDAATLRPATVGAAYQRAAAEELLRAREEALAAMRRQGVIVVDVPPQRAAQAVVERYRELKRRGVL